MNFSPFQLKTLVNDIEKEWKNYGNDIQEHFLNQSQIISRLNNEFKKIVNEIEKEWTSMRIYFKDTYDKIIPQLQKTVSFEYELYQKEKQFEHIQNQFNINQEYFENNKQKYEEMYHLPTGILELNVGGEYFCTLQSTLTDVVPDSMLSSMFSGRWPITKDINGHCYIDRDPYLFQFVLNGLRNNGHWFELFDPEANKALSIELDYFCLKMLIDQEDFHKYNRIYIMGGWTASVTQKKIEYLDLITEQWVSAGDLSVVRDYYAAVSTNYHRIYILGGYQQNTVEYLDTIENQWYSVKPMSKERWGPAAVYFKGNIFVMGGDDDENNHNDVECYNIENDIWIKKSQMQIARSFFAATVLENEIYVIGGRSSYYGNPLNSAEKYNEINDNWTYIASLLTSRTFLAAVTMKDSIYALGGFDGLNKLQSVECYKPINNSWNYINSMKSARSSFAAVSANNNIYIFGGWDFSGEYLNSVERFEPECEEWQYITNMEYGRTRFVAVAV